MENQLDDTLLGDLTNIEKSLSEDANGDLARKLLSYFNEATELAEAGLLQAADDTERHFASRLVEGLHAAQRIIRSVWEILHAAALPA